MKKTSTGLIAVMALSLILFGLSGCGNKGATDAGDGSGGNKSVVVGAKNYTEQYVAGNLMAILLRENGFEVKEQFGTGSKITRDGLLSGQTDLYAEYTGTAWAVYLQQDTPINDPEELYQQIKEIDLRENEVIWLDRWVLNNTYALAVKKDKVDTYGKTISELGEYVNQNPKALKFGVNQEFYERPDGLFRMIQYYGFNVPEAQVKTMDTGLSYEALHRDQVDVAMVFSTDGLIRKYDLQVLRDDRQFFPIYNLCINIRKDTLEKYPEIRDIMAPLTALLDDETMQELNYRVDAEGLPEDVVAREFLKDHDLIK